MKEGQHEAKVQTVLGTVVELLKSTRYTSENIPRLSALADSICKVMHLAKSVRIRHAERLRAVEEEGENVDIFFGKCLAKRGLVNAIERAGSEVARLLLVQDLLSKVTALSGGGLGRTREVKGLLLVTKLDIHLLAHAGGNARVDNGLRQPRLVVSLVETNFFDQRLVHSITSSHQTIAQVGVLVQFELTTAKVEFILVVSLGEFLGHAAVRSSLKGGLEDNLSRATAKVEDSRSLARVRATDFSK